MELSLASNYLQTRSKKYWLIRHNEVSNEACFQTTRKYILFTEKIIWDLALGMLEDSFEGTSQI
jgi:hypothetical protein